MKRTGRILIVLTSHDRLGETGRPTGFYLPEAAHPWHEFIAAGYTIDLVSPAGGKPPMDGVDTSDPLQRAFLDDPAMTDQLGHTLRPDEVDAADYDAVFFAGGHGTMWDFRGNAALAAIGRDVYEAGGVVAAVCHGPAGIVDITLSNGRPLVDGRRVAAFTNDEERAVGLTNIVPYLLQDALEERGATHDGGANFAAHVIVDGRLVTGQNPASAAGTAKAAVEVLDGRGA